ncbi:MAG: sodium ion-translocating decarboxylase subunit beta [Chloroflexi bacterium]|nr:sodium ion-translocating decarboxylase subunit beta [Chloroflexota bacterium]
MVLIALGFIFLAIHKGFEPLLLIPIGVGIMLANVPFGGLGEDEGLLVLLKRYGLSTELFPLLMFLGLGALTDFTPLIQRPWMALLGAAAQIGIFGTLLGAIALGFTLENAGAIGIIGGADGPTAIFVSIRLADEALLGPIAISAYSYMAMVPIIQPPIMRALTSRSERMVEMPYEPRPVPKLLKLLFPLTVLLLAVLFAPGSIPLIGMFMFGNLLRESGVVERLSSTAQNELINIVTILLGLTVGGTMVADAFLDVDTLKVFGLGLVAFSLATAGGVVFGKIMYLASGRKVNPLLGAAGVSAVPMSARVVHRVALEANPNNYLVMHAMGPNVAGVLGSAIAAGVILNMVG